MTQWIGAIARGHNGGACLLKDGEVVFNIEEERLTRNKYDGAPLAAITQFKKYTDKLDYLLIAHTTPLTSQPDLRLDYCLDDPYFGMVRKLGLMLTPEPDTCSDFFDMESGERRPNNVIDMGQIHHRLHAATAFYNSGFKEAAAVIVDGAGSWMRFGPAEKYIEDYWETETIFDCAYPAKFDTRYKHIGTKFATPFCYFNEFDTSFFNEFNANSPKNEGNISWESESNDSCEFVASHAAGIVKTYEAITEYCGWTSIEAGKTMGLAPYGKAVDYIPPFFKDAGIVPTQRADNNIFCPLYPQGALYLMHHTPEINMDKLEPDMKGMYDLDNRKNSAWRVQNDTQEQVLALIRKAVKDTGHKNVVVSGGYGLNCVANYWFLDQLKDEGINLYVEPVSNDGGTALGAALLWHHYKNQDVRQRERITNLYTGIHYDYSEEDLLAMSKKYGGRTIDATDKDVIDLILDKNIVALFQGRSESGPRALGNRSILYDPTDPNGKDHVNTVKNREFFRPFAGTILQEHVHEWFDLRGMDETPFMMYAVECKPGVEEKIPAILHVDKTCRIQTVTKEQNENYYNLIQEFFERTGCPILFNTSFNLGGEPLVETLEDAVSTLLASDIEYLYLPEFGKMIVMPNHGNMNIL